MIPREVYQRELMLRKMRRRAAARILEYVRENDLPGHGRAVARYVDAQRYLQRLYDSPDDYQDHWKNL